VSSGFVIAGGGMIVGMLIWKSGYKYGFSASYQIREDPDKGLFTKTGEPKEFAILEQQEKDEQSE
jgi:hypothetical protein